ncbi:MAG TPA: EamA family transporter [Ktedonobacterales bacterium]
MQPVAQSTALTPPATPLARRAPLAQGARRVRAMGASLPPTGLLLTSMLIMQIGSATAKHLFVAVGTSGAVFLRAGFGAAVLLALWRPNLRAMTRTQWGVAALFGLIVAVMNSVFYAALARLPLGVAVTVEFLGPLAVAVLGSRRRLDLLWVALAASGVALFAPWGGQRLDPVGLLFALAAGVFWALYILIGARLGRAFSGGGGLAVALTVAALALAPIGISAAGTDLARPNVLLLGAVVGLCSAVIPFSLEVAALRRMPPHVFGIFMSLEPAVATLTGLLALRELLGWRSIVAIALVTAASVGASRAGRAR